MKRALSFRKTKPEPARVMELQLEPKENDELAHQQLPSNFAISFEDRLAQQKLRASRSRDKSKSKLAKETLAKSRPAGCSSEGRPAILLVRGCLWISGRLCDVCELQGKRSGLETKREDLCLREF